MTAGASPNHLAAGNEHVAHGEYALARRAFEACLALEPANAQARHGLGGALFKLGEVEAAAEQFHVAAEKGHVLASWLALATILPGCPGADHARIHAVRRRFAQELAAHNPAPAPAAAPQPKRHRAPGRRIRVGYLSSFFDRPNYMKPVWGLLEHHDRARFEIHLFADTPQPLPWDGQRLQAMDQVHHIAALEKARLASFIRACELDVLVDLNGYSAPDRLALFLQRVAPVSVAWFNQYATSGLPALDWIVGDDEVIRREEERFYTERVWRLPCSYLTFDVQHPAPPVAPAPCLARGYITFGSLVSQYKITPPVLDTWAEILKRTPGTRLLLANAALRSEENRRYVLGQFDARGVHAARLDLRPPAEHFSFLKYYDEIDVALDAFPYNGGTTTMEAIWQGVPVLAAAGDRWAARTSQTLLRRTHLAEFVAPSTPAMPGTPRMIDAAVALASHPATPARLTDLRASMRARLRASPACDTTALARALEAFFRHAVEE
jgi:predicted O-linked N-acetylglucosamine transferase (SPINDLY family)